MKFSIHIHIHIHRLSVDIYGYIHIHRSISTDLVCIIHWISSKHSWLRACINIKKQKIERLQLINTKTCFTNARTCSLKDVSLHVIKNTQFPLNRLSGFRLRLRLSIYCSPNVNSMSLHARLGISISEEELKKGKSFCQKQSGVFLLQLQPIHPPYPVPFYSLTPRL